MSCPSHPPIRKNGTLLQPSAPERVLAGMEADGPAIPEQFEAIPAGTAAQIIDCLREKPAHRFVMLHLMSWESVALTEGRTVRLVHAGQPLYQCLEPLIAHTTPGGLREVIVLDCPLRRGWKSDFWTGARFLSETSE